MAAVESAPAALYDDAMDLDDDAVEAMMRGEVSSHGSKSKLSRSQKRRAKQRLHRAAAPDSASSATPATQTSTPTPSDSSDVVVEYITPDLASAVDVSSHPEYAQFLEVFQRFGGVPAAAPAAPPAADTPTPPVETPGETEEGGDDAESKLSRRQRKKLQAFEVAALKQAVAHPEVVEAHDVTSPDPVLLVHLKAARNSVPIPRHWCHKRKYLAGKRGFDKPPFELPAFIAATGITKLRGADLEAQADRSLKGKQRDRYIPKMGRIEIEYSVLHDAFFKFQTRPKLSRFGELYYEGKELENNYAETKKPGVVSERLRTALGVAEGSPPPWLVNMQRYGPPPSYPNLRIPGVNAPLPPGAAYGTHAGGWGRPPVDEFGRPLYGDVFGVAVLPEGEGTGAVKHRWGEVRADVEPPLPATAGLENEDTLGAPAPAAEEAVEETSAPTEGGASAASASASGIETPLDGALSVSRSMMSGLDTPDELNLRKGSRRTGMETPDSVAAAPAPELYRVLEQRSTALTGTILGTSHTYVMPPASDAPAPAASSSSRFSSGGDGGAVIALAPDELEKLDADALAKKYQDELQQTQSQLAASKAEFVDLLEEQERKRRRKETGPVADGRKTKKAREFKF